MPTISVVIPTYNRATTIVACIKSVLAQSYTINEILIIDDCSTDDTIDRLKKFKEKLILLNTNTHSGAQVARNIGIKAATSEWITFLDSDDEWLPNKLEKQIAALKIANYNPMTVVHGDCYIKNKDSDKTKYWKLHKIDGINVYKQLLAKSGTFFPAILTSKIALKRINFLDENIPSYHEWDTAIRLAKFCRFIHIQEPLFIYNIHNNTISKNLNTATYGYKYIVNKFSEEIKELCGEDVFSNHLIINSVMAINNSENKLGRTILRQVPNNFFKKNILQLFSYLNIKPIYLTKIFQFLFRSK